MRVRIALLSTGPGAQHRIATQVEHLDDSRRRFRLTPEDFALINPNTRTCPMFRSEQDARLAKKLYRAVPVLIRDGEANGNPWSIELRRMLHMSDDSGSFESAPGAGLVPVYEAKMVHQFDHRWATYMNTSEGDDVETKDVSDTQKANPAFSVRPRYWVTEHG